MTEVTFEGVLDAYAGSWGATQPEIGGNRVFDVIEEKFGGRPVRVYLGVEPEERMPPADRPTEVLAEGENEMWTGWGGTDVTPPDPPEMYVGGFDVLARLRQLDDRYVVLVVEDV